MTKDWFEVIKKYLSLETKVRIDGEEEQVGEFFTDSSQANEIINKLRRSKEQDKERNAIFIKGEIKLDRCEIKKEGTDEIIVKIPLYQRWVYKLKDMFYEQEKLGIREICLKEQYGSWRLLKDEMDAGLRIQDAPETMAKEGIPPFFHETNENDANQITNRGIYNRLKAQRYAEIWWNQYNPQYEKFEADCTNFVSQCLLAGGVPMTYTGNQGKGWWYRNNGNLHHWSYSWVVAHSLRWYLSTSRNGLRAVEVSSPHKLSIGDVISYDYDGDGHWQHNTIVVLKDSNDMPLVNAHTNNSRHRYWDYRDSAAWTPHIKYKFFHIVDEF
ncbi:amidase domain-containing protein [Microaerobacter geothermalis]|uniref:amidase domain-containing protein n=1 Tax=Microaerobacter geothermalis TaxID=674972 RepID=UPI001F3D1D4E|nr:amidase domain-containing protein [Microaerobacter geothermalis]MCF6094598.1 amidase domain-containing protein [Microaerobacter geothermalis]